MIIYIIILIVLLIIFLFTTNCEKKEDFSCATGQTCCLPGFYGKDNHAGCTLCPANKPSSPFEAPDGNCSCPNSSIDKCFACTDPCKPYDSQSRTCLPYQCQSSTTCKVVDGKATCINNHEEMCDPCRPYDPITRTCQPYKCPIGQYCKVVEGKATCIDEAMCDPCRPYDPITRTCQPYKCPTGQYCKVVDGKATCVKPSCGENKQCCPPGYYGDKSGDCTECPSDKPSSIFSKPNKDCLCPNSDINKCFACTSKCRTYDPISRTCQPYKCPIGQTCKVVNNQATCV